MKIYQAYLNWPAGEETIGIFTSPQKAEEYWMKNYEGKTFIQGSKYTKNMLNIEEYELDEGTGPYID